MFNFCIFHPQPWHLSSPGHRHWEDLHEFPTSRLDPVSLEALEAPASRPSSSPDVHINSRRWKTVESTSWDPHGCGSSPTSILNFFEENAGWRSLSLLWAISTSTPPKLNCTIKKRPWIARWECFSVRWNLETSPRSERRRNFQVPIRVVWSFERSRPHRLRWKTPGETRRIFPK